MNLFQKMFFLFSSILVFSTTAGEDAHHYPEIFIGATHVDSETNLTYAMEYEY